MPSSFGIKPEMERVLEKLKKKDPSLYQRILKNKPLSNVLSGVRRVHFNPSVLIFSINKKEKKVEFLTLTITITFTGNRRDARMAMYYP